MKSHHQSTNHSVQFKLKPVSVMIFTLFAQQAYAEALTEAQVHTKQAQQKQCEQTSTSSHAKAMCKNEPLQAQLAADAAFDQAIAAQEQMRSAQHQAKPAQNIQIADASEPYGNTPLNVSKDIIRTAEVTDANPAGSSRLAKDEGKNKLPIDIKTQAVTVRAKRFHEIGPLPGLGLTKDQIPGNVQSITAKEIKESHSLSLTDLMNKKLQSVNVNDYQGNPFQMDVTYRGFTAGPQIGTPQGLSVFLDGIRVNEPFGDVVNWDMIPMNAIAGVDVFPGSNPIFGLNTLGGAFTLKTKDGFTNEGVDAEVLTGSFGRKQLQVEGGINNGDFALFGAGNFFLEDGWRDNSPSKVNQAFGKASYRGEKLDLSLSTLLVQTDLVGNGLLPSEMYAQDQSSVFTSPDTTKNRLAQFQLSSSYFVNDNFTITGQVYRRNSKRHQKGADVFTDYRDGLLARRKPDPGDPANGIEGEQYTCLLASTNAYGIPDYYLIPVNQTAGEDIFSFGLASDVILNDYLANGFISPTYDYLINNPINDANYVAALKQTFNFWRNPAESMVYNRDVPSPPLPDPFVDPFGLPTTTYNAGGASNQAIFSGIAPGSNVTDPFSDLFFYSTASNGDVIKNLVIPLAPVNADNCIATQSTNAGGNGGLGGPAYTYLDSSGNTAHVDGAFGAGVAPGVVEGTPTAIINNNQIDQVVDGASVQFNWNFEQHKFMIGASIDAASADYSNTSQLGFLTTDRAAYLDPAQALPQFIGAFQPISNNNFEGTNTTKSVYFSETWTPTKAWNFSASGRYNETQTKNKIAARYGFGAYGIGDLTAVPDDYNVCDGDCTTNPPPTNYRPARIFNALDKAETEKFSYYSFNPSFGATWQAKENLNIFANWAKGTRTPSVIELGCAFDKTPVAIAGGGGATLPKSIIENRQCTLPTTLSGDPFLPQIKATTYDVGMRGFLGENLQWNLGAYQTDLKDDIYFVAVGNGAGFFDSIGKTRRRGLEAGLSGRQGKLSFSLNYGLTDATFQDNFLMFSEDNSSSKFVNGFGDGVIQVKKGNRMPGVPLHNLNASIGYEITDKWNIGFSGILHSESFVRGNENNEHKVGVIQDRGLGAIGNALVQPTTNPGKVQGYATFNFQTSYKLAAEWSATLLVSNIFDKEYFSAGRLGRSPFSPSINGAVGPDGYNHNSNDWLSTNFIAPATPRAAWVSIRYEFAPDKK
ncbi:MAG: TonB-dependent receptor [Methylotenera sp.]|uniref:TonB-dependent receptor n=1 Tax=Methylotenera sp. TaxID=2051956 RepID=UPI002488B832|nr:TonB-dependent receptor [Methylotenera sp.]MDI1308947.1 TonB-dependent receptor [Methylotenera sp.]